MSLKQINGIECGIPRGFVLDNRTPEEVAMAMIESGQQNQPFYIFDMDEALSRIRHFQKKLPRVNICYAIKANNNAMLLKLAITEGLGFDCASPGEIKMAVDLGASARSIVYAIPSKMPEEMMFARKAGVKHTTFDTSNELKKIKQYWPDASLLIRIRVESKSIYNLGEKFGCDFETEATNLLDQAAALGLRVAGVAFHVGSVCFSPESYEIGLRNAHALFEYESRAGRRMSVLDIGGGFLSDKTNSIDEVADIINSTLDEIFPHRSIQIIAEPGRYICDSAFTLYCNLNNVRMVKNGSKDTKQLIYMNDGVFGTLRFSEPWNTVHILKGSSNIEDEEPMEVILFGPSGDNQDQVMRDHKVRLPRCSPTDWLVFSKRGAYSTVFSTYFSCLPMPLVQPVVSLDTWNIIKTGTAFSAADFTEDPDISLPLPSTIPSLPFSEKTQNMDECFILQL